MHVAFFPLSIIKSTLNEIYLLEFGREYKDFVLFLSFDWVYKVVMYTVTD